MASTGEPLLQNADQSRASSMKGQIGPPFLRCITMAVSLLLVGTLALLLPAQSHSPSQRGSSLGESLTLANLGTVNKKLSSCECIDWKEAFSTYGVDCEDMGEEFCDKFFKRIPDNYCINSNYSYAPSQVCYVSSACSVASPVPNNTQVSMKTCSQGDKMLMNYSFDELYDVCKVQNENLDLGLIIHFAYRWWTADTWSAVKSEILNGPTRSDLKEMVASNEPFFINSESGHPPFGLVKGGSTVAEVHFGPFGPLFYQFWVMGAVNVLECLKGCK